MGRTVGAPVEELKHPLRGDLHSPGVDADLRLMRYFVAVAEELHFTRAAQRLHMAQQPLSAAIARLEAQLGVRLLDRTTRRVALTEAGAAFLEAARTAVAAADAAVEVARASASGVTGEVSIGISSGAWYGLGDLFADLRSRRPGLRLNVRQQSTRPIIAAVRSGELDLGVGLCVADVPEDVDMHRLRDEPVVLVVSSAHPLAASGSASLVAVRDEVIALDEPAEGRDYNDAVMRLCRASGFEPRVRELQTHHDAWERSIADGQCVGLDISCSLQTAHPGVCIVPVDPPATFPLDLLWRRPAGEPLRPAVHAVLEVAGARA
jgi:DNA-binding transcriptional LysR family regulator